MKEFSSIGAILLIFAFVPLHSTSAISFADVSDVNFVTRMVSHARDEHISVEVAIVCDLEFGSLFQFDYRKIQLYLQALFWDVQLRFGTLQTAKISFRITSVTVITDSEHQSFVESVRTKEGKVSVTDILDHFNKWLLVQTLNWFIPNYDIAILLTGAKIEGINHGVSRLRGACLMDFAKGQVVSSAVVAFQPENFAHAMALAIAHLLGASHDDEETYKLFDCGVYNASEQYLMRLGSRGKQSHFFSPCSDKSISMFLRTIQAHQCLHGRELTEVQTRLPPRFDTATFAEDPLLIVGVSREEQCQLMLNSSTATAQPLFPDLPCYLTVCRVESSNENLTSKILQPLEGTPCDRNDGRCFRGHCQKPWTQLRNAATGQCIVNVDQFSANNLPIMSTCKAITVLFDHIHFASKGNGKVYILMWHTSRNGNDTLLKCLTADDVELSSPRFEGCNPNKAYLWDVVKLKMKHEHPYLPAHFLLRHKQTKRCVSVVDNTDKLVLTSNCSLANKKIFWNILENDRMLTYEVLHKRFGEANKVDIRVFWYIFQFLGELGLALLLIKGLWRLA